MKTYYLKNSSEQELWESLEAAGIARKRYHSDDPLNVHPGIDREKDSDGYVDNWQPTGSYDWEQAISPMMLDLIGTIHRRNGQQTTDEFGNTIFLSEALEGYHANLRVDLDSAQEGCLSIVGKPNNPYRKWAGN